MSKILAVVINSHQIHKQKNSDYFSLLSKISTPDNENYIIDLCNLMKSKSCKTKLHKIIPKKKTILVCSWNLY